MGPICEVVGEVHTQSKGQVVGGKTLCDVRKPGLSHAACQCQTVATADIHHTYHI